jgi:uncharacterized protein YkwD
MTQTLRRFATGAALWCTLEMPRQFMNQHHYVRFVVLAPAVVLAACGGGGGDGEPITSAPAPSGNSAPTTPTTSGPQTSVPAPTYAAGTFQADAFARINEIRAEAGLGLLAQHAMLDQAAQSHVNYIENHGLSTYGHGETPGRDLFTGATPVDRAAAAGYVGYAGELLSAGLAEDSVNSLLDGPYHRAPLLSYRVADVGIGTTPSSINAFLLGYRGEGQSAPATAAVLWPAHNATDVRTKVNGEVPNPMPENNGGPYGYPVSIHVDDTKTLSVNNFTLTGPTGALNVKLIHRSVDANMAWPNFAAIIARSPLQAGTAYTANFTAS